MSEAPRSGGPRPKVTATTSGITTAADADATAAASVVESAAVFALGTLLSRVLGLVRDIIIARYFSVDVRDAFINAFRLPNVFRRVFGEGALSASFIPVFVEVVASRTLTGSESQRRTKQLLAGVFSILLTMVITVSLLSVVFMEDLLRLLLGGTAYVSIPGKLELTIRLARIMFSFLILISVFAYFMAILNGLRKFAASALAPCFFNLTIIAVAMLFSRTTGDAIVLAWAVLAGGCAQALVVGISLWRSGLLPRLSFRWDNPDVARVVKAIVPAMLGLSVLQLTTIVNMHFASRLPAGSHSYLYLADRILELPLSLFVVSLGAALLPTLSQNWVDGDKAAMGKTINHFVRLIVFVSLPAAIGMFILAQPIAEVLFLGREFKYEDALKTSQVLQVYSFGLIISAGVRILAQGFYAIQSVWFPAAAALVALISHTILAYVLSHEFGLTGLAAASVLSASVNLLMLAFAYNSWVGSLQLKGLLKSIVQYSICVIVMVVVLQMYGPLQRFVGAARPGSRAFVLLTTIAAGAVAYMAFANFLGIPEYKVTAATFVGRLKRIPRPRFLAPRR